MNGEVKKKEGEILIPERPLLEGKALVKARTEYVTAVFVQKPRDLDKINEAIKRECEFGGAKFYYGWTLKRGKSAGKRIEGGSIGLATSLARLWGNVAVPVTVEETEETWMFTASFIDLETGFNLQRVFRYDRATEIPGEYDSSRKEDMKFQIGQSKAIRNVILNGGVPRWMVDGAVKLSKQAVVKEINKEGLAKATRRIVEFFAGHNITDELLVTYIGQPKASWAAETIAHLQGIQQNIEDDQVSPEEVRADMMEKEQEGQEPVKVDKLLGGKEKEAKLAKPEAKKEQPSVSPPSPKEPKVSQPPPSKPKDFPCESPNCKNRLGAAEVGYSKTQFEGKVLCFSCQGKAKKKQSNLSF